MFKTYDSYRTMSHRFISMPITEAKCELVLPQCRSEACCNASVRVSDLHELNDDYASKWCLLLNIN